jgi:hypothetical protein
MIAGLKSRHPPNATSTSFITWIFDRLVCIGYSKINGSIGIKGKREAKTLANAKIPRAKTIVPAKKYTSREANSRERVRITA